MKAAMPLLIALGFLWPQNLARAGDDTVPVRGWSYGGYSYGGDGFAFPGSFPGSFGYGYDSGFFNRRSPFVEVDIFGRRRIFRRAAVRIIIGPTYGGGYSGGGYYGGGFSAGGFSSGGGFCPSGG